MAGGGWEWQRNCLIFHTSFTQCKQQVILQDALGPCHVISQVLNHYSILTLFNSGKLLLVYKATTSIRLALCDLCIKNYSLSLRVFYLRM